MTETAPETAPRLSTPLLVLPNYSANSGQIGGISKTDLKSFIRTLPTFQDIIVLIRRQTGQPMSSNFLFLKISYMPRPLQSSNL
jgi:hypothetical protein